MDDERNRQIQEQQVRADRDRFHLDQPGGWDEATVQRITDIMVSRRGTLSKAEQDRNYRRRHKQAS